MLTNGAGLVACSPDRHTACPGVTLRPFEDADLAFLSRVYAASRADEMALLTDWSDGEKEKFMRFQFEAQHAHYREHYPNARYDIIVKEREEIGRFYVERMSNEIRILDIALLPQHRGQGIGRALVQEVLDEAEQSRQQVSLHVEEYNPAMRLYQRLGFVVVGDVSVYKLMHWVPPGLAPRDEGEMAPHDPDGRAQANTAS